VLVSRLSDIQIFLSEFQFHDSGSFEKDILDEYGSYGFAVNDYEGDRNGLCRSNLATRSPKRLHVKGLI
jgi:hypothetical protein